VRTTPIADLPDDALLFLVSSRYCDSGQLADFAWSQFGKLSGGARCVQAICDFAHAKMRTSRSSDVAATDSGPGRRCNRIEQATRSDRPGCRARRPMVTTSRTITSEAFVIVSAQHFGGPRESRQQSKLGTRLIGLEHGSRLRLLAPAVDPSKL
jgi:hypothetical protein